MLLLVGEEEEEEEEEEHCEEKDKHKLPEASILSKIVCAR